MFWVFFSQALQKGKNTFYSEVFALAVYPAAGNSFLLYTETESQQNISKMYLLFHSESHPKKSTCFQDIRVYYPILQNEQVAKLCESSQVSWGYVGLSPQEAQHRLKLRTTQSFCLGGDLAIFFPPNSQQTFSHT